MKKMIAGFSLAFAMTCGTMCQATELEEPTVETLVQSFGGAKRVKRYAEAGTIGYVIKRGATAGPSLQDFTPQDYDETRNIVSFSGKTIDELVAKFGLPARVVHSPRTGAIELQYNLEKGLEAETSRGCLIDNLKARTLKTCGFG